jgi:hypothetical protein
VRAAVPITLAALALALSACGEKDEPGAVPQVGAGQLGDGGGTEGAGGGGSGDGSAQSSGVAPEEQIERAIEAVIGGNDPQKTCEELATIVYVKHSYGDVQGCRSAVTKQDPFAVDVTGTDVTGKTATAKAKPRGGPNEGETLKVELVREGDAWKVDVVRSTAKVGP